MRRVCAGTLQHYEQTVRERVGARAGRIDEVANTRLIHQSILCAPQPSSFVARLFYSMPVSARTCPTCVLHARTFVLPLSTGAPMLNLLLGKPLSDYFFIFVHHFTFSQLNPVRCVPPV